MVIFAYGASAAVLSYDELLAEAVVKYEEGDTVAAGELLGQIIQEYPDDPAANYYLAGILNDRGLYEAALDSYKKAAKSAEFSDALFNVGYLSYELGDPDTALEYYDRYLEYRPGDSAALYNKGIIYSSLGNDEYAAKCYEGAIDSDPYNVDALHNLAVIYYDTYEYERAVHYWNRLLELDGEDVDALYGRGLALYELDEYDDAIESITRGAELAPDDGRFPYQLGNIHYSLNELDGALAGFAEAYRLDYAADEDAYYLGFIYSDLHKYNLALKYFARAAELNRNYAIVHVEMARIYRAMGKNASALEELRKAEEKNYADEVELAYEFGMTYKALGLFENAADYFADAVRLDGSLLEAHYRLAEAYEGFDEAKALRQWRRYVELADGHPGEKYSVKEARSRIADLGSKDARD
ncbi:MAG: tetratricopeptide repeat protein [Candidatus Coatesbacteria bacterium]|nr:MAG: tetratricopeptide repeat protein [Candidatus Coatesbacteria bacterium]